MADHREDPPCPSERKNSPYEGGTRQPLIIRWPGHVTPGSRDEETIAQTVDIFPTLTNIAGASGPQHPDGIDVRSAWLGKPLGHRPDLYWTYGAYGPYEAWTHPGDPHDRSPTFSIRSGNWKLLADGDGSNAQLFDIVKDPLKTRDLAG